MNFIGQPSGYYNIKKYPYSASVNINTYFSSLCSVQRASNTGASLLTLRPTGIPSFTQFVPNSGYIVLAKENFTVVNPVPTPTPTPTIFPLFAADFIPLEITTNGSSYNISQFGTNNPSLTCHRGTNYDFIPINLQSHPFALRANLNDTSTSVSGTFNNNPSTGIIGSRIYFTPNNSTPNTIYYQCAIHSSMSGTISILDY